LSASVFFLAPLRLASFCKHFSHGCGDSALRPFFTGPHTGPQRSTDLPYLVFCRLIVLLHKDVLGGLDLYETIGKIQLYRISVPLQGRIQSGDLCINYFGVGYSFFNFFDPSRTLFLCALSRRTCVVPAGLADLRIVCSRVSRFIALHSHALFWRRGLRVLHGSRSCI